MNYQQTSFLKSISPAFGGALQKGKRKTYRPLDSKATVHLVLKSSRAKGAWSLLQPRHKTRIHDLLKKLSKDHGIKIFNYTNVGNHLHILLKISNRRDFQKFLRIFTGRVALLITQAKRGKPKGKFWDELAFTRIVQWGKDFKRITHYFLKNKI